MLECLSKVYVIMSLVCLRLSMAHSYTHRIMCELISMGCTVVHVHLLMLLLISLFYECATLPLASFVLLVLCPVLVQPNGHPLLSVSSTKFYQHKHVFIQNSFPECLLPPGPSPNTRGFQVILLSSHSIPCPFHSEV